MNGEIFNYKKKNQLAQKIIWNAQQSIQIQLSYLQVVQKISLSSKKMVITTRTSVISKRMSVISTHTSALSTRRV
jgi:hypothetical protein